MKIFIVFLGLLLINISAISYRGDFDKYSQLHRALSDVAWECAEFAAEDPENAQNFAEGLLIYTAKNFNGVKVNDYSCDISYSDEFAEVRMQMNVKGLFKFLSLRGVDIFAKSRCALTPENEPIEEDELYPEPQ
jgi:hypothetical protein